VSYIIETIQFSAPPSRSTSELDGLLQDHLNYKHNHSQPGELVNVISLTYLYRDPGDCAASVPCGLVAKLCWRTHAVWSKS